MALADINFAEGDNQHFLVELPTGTLNPPADILVEAAGSRYPVLETPAGSGGEGDIFIIND